MSVSWTEDPIPVPGVFNAAEAATAAHHAQYAALAGREPADWASPWGAGDVRRQAAEQEHEDYLARYVEADGSRLVKCDGCGRDVPLDETLPGRALDLYCGACVEAEQEDAWVPEEWFESGGEP